MPKSRETALTEREVEDFIELDDFESLLRQSMQWANHERRKLYDKALRILGTMQYNWVGNVERQAFHKDICVDKNEVSWQRKAVIAYKYYREEDMFAWHVIINDSCNEGPKTRLFYTEYVLPEDRRIFDFRFNEASFPSGVPPTRKDLYGCALIISQPVGSNFRILRGEGSGLIYPPAKWCIQDAQERLIVHDELESLIDILNSMKEGDTFIEGVKGSLE